MQPDVTEMGMPELNAKNDPVHESRLHEKLPREELSESVQCHALVPPLLL